MYIESVSGIKHIVSQMTREEKRMVSQWCLTGMYEKEVHKVFNRIASGFPYQYRLVSLAKAISEGI